MTTTKNCPQCGPLHVDAFAKNRSRKDGLNGECKKCSRKRSSAAADRNKAKNTPAAPPPGVAEVEAFYKAVDRIQLPVESEPVPPLDPLEAARSADRDARNRRDLKAEHRALLGEVSRLQDRIGAMESAIRTPEIIVYDKAAWARMDAIPCALASDWHIEEPVAASDVHNLNEYNLEIARSRSEFFFKNFLQLALMMARESKVKVIYLAMLGDFFSGFIHEELLANCLLAPGDAAREVASLLCSGIDFLLKESTFEIVGDALAGNHGRMTKQMWHGDPTGTSLETFMYHMVAARYHDNPRVKITVADRAMVYRDFFESFKLRLIHGWEVKYGGGIGGLTIPLNKALAQWDRPIKATLTVLGHFHQFLDGGNFIVNGSLIGYNTFAQTIRASYEDPKQAFFLIHARGGGEKSIVAPIWLDKK